MIAATPLTDHTFPPPGAWRRALREAITDPAELLRALDLDSSWLDAAGRAARRFPLKAPRGFVGRMRRGDPNDPLLLQVLPLHAELLDAIGYGGDPVGDLASVRGAGLLHKYQGRALLIATGACAIHCRYCFRREFPYADHVAAAASWQPAIDALACDPSIHELILSGGDPLSLSTDKLSALTDGLRGLPHLRRLRIHTRYPIVLPERIDLAFTRWLAAAPWQKIVVIHANHPNELDGAVERTLRHLTGAGATLLNQSVLLRGINDRADTLQALSEGLFAMGVLPYYLHMLDPVRGAAHFNVEPEKAAQLMRSMASRLPGYLVPRLVREQAGAPYKISLAW